MVSITRGKEQLHIVTDDAALLKDHMKTKMERKLVADVMFGEAIVASRMKRLGIATERARDYTRDFVEESITKYRNIAEERERERAREIHNARGPTMER